MSDNLEELLKALDAPLDPALPSVKRILAALRDERFSGIVELTYRAGRVVKVRKK